MTAFQQFRLWARRAPLAERLSAASAAVVLVAAVSWLLVPASSHSTAFQSVQSGGTFAGGGAVASGSTTTVAGSSSQTTAPAALAQGSPTAGSSAQGQGATIPGQTVSGAPGAGSGPGNPAPNTGGGITTGVGTPGGGGPAKAGCVSPAGSDQGVTPTTIKVAILLVNLVGPEGNSAVGVPPANVQQQDYQEVADAINASGGVACRKLVLDFLTDNPVDQSDLQQKCLQVVQDRVFFAIDLGGYSAYPALMNCYAQNQIPFFAGSSMANDQLQPFYPYMFTANDADIQYRNTVFALRQRGFFDATNGFKKLGYLYRDCDPKIPSEFQGWLQQAGLSSAQVVPFDEGCPATLIPSPSVLEQGVLTFQEHGVTNVTETQGDLNDFSKIAQQQGFHPKYGIPDDDVIFMTYGSNPPDSNNIANTIAIAQERFGEEHTPGITPNAGTVKCNQIMAAHGQPPVFQQELGMGGVACDQLWTVQVAAEHAPVLQRNALAAGLQAARSIDYSYPYGPNDFSGTHVTYGGQFWRPDQYFTSCTCWRVIGGFNPPFP